MTEEAEYWEHWEELERRAGRKFSYAQKKKLKEECIAFEKFEGRPPHRCKVIFGYWSLYLRFMMKTQGKFIIFLFFMNFLLS